MVEVIIKYFILLICSFYIFLELLNCKLTRKAFLVYVLFSAIITFLIYAIRLFSVSLSIIFIYFYLVIYAIRTVKISINLSMTTSVISLAISYVAFFVSTALIIVLEYSFTQLLGTNHFPNPFFIICTVIIQLLLVIVTFKIKRLKNGMPFLLERGSSDIGVFICFSLLLSTSFFKVNNNGELIYLLPVFFILISGLIVIFWWRNSITKKYIDKVKSQEMQVLQEAVKKKDAEISQLKRHNEELSKIIHKDNKLIPALEYAVRQYLLSTESETDRVARTAQAKKLISQIETASHERRGIITSYESNSKSLPSTGVPSIDSLLKYMLQKSNEQQIDFNLSLSGSVKYLVESIATEQDINTLLADLIENAIIATKKCVPRNILVHIGIADNCYSIGIFDNGIAFTRETIKDIGLKRTTTHAGEGGSGIGLMTTFEILKKHKASFVIEDIADNVLYTKNVSVCFDNLGQFRIKSKLINKSDLYHGCEDLMLMRDLGA